MAMPTYVDYKVLWDGVFELDSENQDHFLEFTMPNNLVHGTDLAKPILAFIVRPVEETQVGIRVNHTDILSETYAPSVRRAFWEPFSGKLLGTGDSNNQIRFHLDSGRVRFSEVVLWYQRRV